MSQAITVQFGDHSFYIPKWNLKKILAKQNLITKILSEPLSMIFAAGEDIDENVRMASLIDVFMKTLSEQDLTKVVPQLLEGTLIVNENSVRVPATLDKMDELGVDFSHVLGACGAVIKHNYGSMLKNGFGETFETVMNL